MPPKEWWERDIHLPCSLHFVTNPVPTDLPKLTHSLSLQAAPTILKPSTYIIHPRPFKIIVLAIPATAGILKSGLSVNVSSDRLTDLFILEFCQIRPASNTNKTRSLITCHVVLRREVGPHCSQESSSTGQCVEKWSSQHCQFSGLHGEFSKSTELRLRCNYRGWQDPKARAC